MEVPIVIILSDFIMLCCIFEQSSCFSVLFNFVLIKAVFFKISNIFGVFLFSFRFSTPDNTHTSRKIRIYSNIVSWRQEIHRVKLSPLATDDDNNHMQSYAVHRLSTISINKVAVSIATRFFFRLCKKWRPRQCTVSACN